MFSWDAVLAALLGPSAEDAGGPEEEVWVVTWKPGQGVIL